MAIQPWKIISSEMVVDHQWYRLRRDVVRLPDGRIVDDYFVSERPNIAVVVPIAQDGSVVLVRQYKHGVQQVTLEFPAGTFFPNEEPKIAALRELEEETGFLTTDLVQLGVCFDNSSKHSNMTYFFLALDCTASGTRCLDELEASGGLEVAILSMDEVVEALETGTIAAMSSVTAGYKALRRLKR